MKQSTKEGHLKCGALACLRTLGRVIPSGQPGFVATVLPAISAMLIQKRHMPNAAPVDVGSNQCPVDDNGHVGRTMLRSVPTRFSDFAENRENMIGY